MKKECTKDEKQQHSIMPQHGDHRLWPGPLPLSSGWACSSGELVIDVTTPNEKDGGHGRDGQQCSSDKDGFVAVEPANASDQQRGGDVACRVEGLIFPELAVEKFDAHQAHGDRGEGWSEKGSSAPDQNLGSVNHPWLRSNG